MKRNSLFKLLGVSFVLVLSVFFVGNNSASADEIATSTDQTVTLHIRYQDAVIYSGKVTLPEATTTSFNDSNGVAHDLSSDSALYLLSLADATSTAFSISDLKYYSSFGSFYINCLDVSATSTIHACANWQYAVNNSDVPVGADKYIAHANDDIYFYYGNQRQFFVSATSTDTATPIIVTVQKYSYVDDSWSSLMGEIVDATQPNPNDQWNPFIIATSTSNASGTASLLLNTPGTYYIGLSDDGFYPSVVTVSSSTVTVATTTATSSVVVSGGGGGGGGQVPAPLFDVSKAVSYLESQQNSDGSFGADLYTDWAAIALSGYGSSQSKQRISSYLSSVNFSGDSVTDNERHAMALEALNINPYSGTSINYIKKITDAFDGTQIGDPNLSNDDIFALFPLIRAGYTTSDQIISKDVQFILSEQLGSGSWGSVDLTAAAIQALSEVSSLDGVNGAISRGKSFLKNSQASGGFGTSYATSWVLQAISSLGEGVADWQQSNSDPLTYLVSYQQTDGGIESVNISLNSRVWATSYAISGALGKSWFDLLYSFLKPFNQTEDNSVATGNETATSTATTTDATAMTTFATTTATTTMIEVQKQALLTVIDTIPTSTPKITSYAKSLKVSESKPEPKITPATTNDSLLTAAVAKTAETNNVPFKTLETIIIGLVIIFAFTYFYKFVKIK